MRAAARILAALSAALALTPPAAAQDGGGRIGLTFEVGATTGSGGVRVISSDPAEPLAGELGPAASASWSLRADLDLERWRVEAGVQYVPASLALEAPDGTQIGIGGLDAEVIELAPRLGYRFLSTADGASLRALAGPSVQLWSTSVSDSRLLMALGADLQLEAPLTAGLRLVARGGVTHGPSFMNPDDEVDGEFEATAVTRWQGGVGLRWLVGS